MVSKNDRLVNYLVDTLVYAILLSIFHALPFGFKYYFFFPMLLFFLYYFGMELLLQRTVGKFVTKTKVVSSKNKRPNIIHIFMRTILRFFTPIDTFSYLTGKEQGIHDVLSRTRLTKLETK